MFGVRETATEIGYAGGCRRSRNPFCASVSLADEEAEIINYRRLSCRVSGRENRGEVDTGSMKAHGLR